MRKKHWIFRIFSFLLCLGIIALGGVWLINRTVVKSAEDRILTAQEASELTDVDCILVLGCLVKDNGVPSDMLSDRLRRGVELYDLGAAGKLLMSGDHGRDGYDEVDAMKRYAVDAGVDSQNVFMDHAGFSTYESLYRARDVFCAKKVIIVTQEYHLYRALYIAEKMGLEAYGVAADYRSYTGQRSRDIREVLARVKDFGTSIFQPEPTYLGETIPVWGDGDLTNDESSDFN